MDHFKLRWLRVVAWPFGNRENIHIPGAKDPDAQLRERNVQNKLELLSTRKNERQCLPFSYSEMKLPTSSFDRLFYATNVQLAMYYIARGTTTTRVREPETVWRLY